ncbi:MAG: hypothetical protein KDD62_08120, partial [Bdellovibrionales bacterium]|nr:hypothetical protein [Bdellovibrionales bacterium]
MTWILLAVLFLGLSALALIHLCQVFYEKFFHRRINDSIREYLKKLIPGSVWRQERNDANPELFLSAQIERYPVELHFIPGRLVKDIPYPHTLRITVSRELPFSFNVTRKSLSPVTRLLDLLVSRFKDRRYVVESGNFCFDLLFECRCEQTREFSELLQRESFRSGLRTCFVKGIQSIGARNGRVAVSYSFTRYAERPRLEFVQDR